MSQTFQASHFNQSNWRKFMLKEKQIAEEREQDYLFDADRYRRNYAWTKGGLLKNIERGNFEIKVNKNQIMWKNNN